MRYYKKKAASDGYMPVPGRQTYRIEQCLSHTEWKSTEQIYREVNASGKKRITRARIRSHLSIHTLNSRLATMNR